MKNTKVTLVPLTADDREQFILDNQWAFKYGAIEEFGKRDDHLDFDGEIISRKTIERCIDSPDSETYRIVVDGRRVGGVILKINKETKHNELEILFVSPEEHTQSASLRYRTGGTTADRTHPLPLGERSRYHRRTQSHQPSPVGARNEQRETRRRRNRAE